MKKTLTLLIVLNCFMLLCQQAPSVGALTIIPQPAYNNSNIRVAVTATTNFQGNSSNLQWYMYTPNVHMKICYSVNSTSSLTVHKDTFNIGMLPPGNYTLVLHSRTHTAGGGCYPGLDSTVVKLPFTVLLSNTVAESENEQLSIYPNPASHFLNVEGMVSEFSYRILSVDGRVLISEKAEKQIDMSALPPGCYFIEVNGKKLHRQRFIKE